jgi:hypothetical protein
MTVEELKSKSVIELKAMAYDFLASIEMNQQNMRVVSQIINEKQSLPIIPEEEKK